MGLLLDDAQPRKLADSIIDLIEKKSQRYEMGLYNHRYILNHMNATQVVRKLESIYSQLR